MIFEVKQTKTNFDMEYIAKDIKGKTICLVKAPLQKNGFNMYLDFITSEYRLYFNNHDTSYGSSLRERYQFKVFKKEEFLGAIDMVTKKAKGFLQTYAAFTLEMEGKAYYMYIVGLGKDGYFLCFYENDEKLVAIAEKDRVTINFKDRYVVYSDSEEHVKHIMLLMMQFDITTFGDIGEVAVRSKQVNNLKSIQKELIAKYDPDFIPRIKAMHGID